MSYGTTPALGLSAAGAPVNRCHADSLEGNGSSVCARTPRLPQAAESRMAPARAQARHAKRARHATTQFPPPGPPAAGTGRFTADNGVSEQLYRLKSRS